MHIHQNFLNGALRARLGPGRILGGDGGSRNTSILYAIDTTSTLAYPALNKLFEDMHNLQKLLKARCARACPLKY